MASPSIDPRGSGETGPRPQVNHKILIVEPDRELLEGTLGFLSPELDVSVAGDGESALEVLRARGPFAAVVTDHRVTDMKGSELLARVREEWPDTVTILQTGAVEVDVVIEALHAGRIFRFLEKACPHERLSLALKDAMVEYRARREARRRADELSFSSRVLTDFNGRLEVLISEQTTALVRLHRFVSDLNSCHSLEEIARATADAVREVCPRRGVLVEVWGGVHAGERFQLHSGPPLGGRRHVQPVETDEGQVGSLVVSSADDVGCALTRTQRAMLASMSASCAVAAHNQIRRLERDEAQHATILALAKLAEHRDNETGKHLERVSQYCRLIAEGLREDGWYRETITNDWIGDLVRSAPLHDIGKVGIPDRILLKPGRLDADEWRVMKTHAEIGEETLRNVMLESHAQSFLEMSMDVAGAHHEKWDGSGYPRGLSGGEIPLSARILALADVYDALTSRRPYKAPWSHEESVSWIHEGAGRHFDPHVVTAFVRRHERANQIRARLADSVEDLEKIGAA